MRKIILTASILSLVIIVSINPAAAEEKYIVIEMGESGQTYSFPISSEEIADHQADIKQLRKIGAAISKTMIKKFTTFEMGESGQIFSFPITPEEISVEDVTKPLLSDIRKKSTVNERQTVAYEMAESGVVIEFPERVLEDHTANIAKIENQ